MNSDVLEKLSALELIEQLETIFIISNPRSRKTRVECALLIAEFNKRDKSIMADIRKHIWRVGYDLHGNLVKQWISVMAELEHQLP